MRIAMVVAEASGDNIAANLICTMKAQNPDVEVSGICGPSMIQQGARAIYKLDDIASLGVEGLFSRLHKILKIRRNYVNSLLENPPDVFVGIDAPDFNLKIEERLRKAGIPTLQYVA
ncbi:MAG: lipid-A-disaccharide synthase, partial [Gammaproteobacteria bacterium]|nr:lipid-A-disaccharide synthase [Gammaproteobacteria bacterium]